MKKQIKRKRAKKEVKAVVVRGKSKPPTQEFYIDAKEWDGIGRAYTY